MFPEIDLKNKNTVFFFVFFWGGEVEGVLGRLLSRDYRAKDVLGLHGEGGYPQNVKNWGNFIYGCSHMCNLDPCSVSGMLLVNKTKGTLVQEHGWVKYHSSTNPGL